MYKVFISREAENYYKKLDRYTKRRINKCIDILSRNPLSGPHVRKLHGVLKNKCRYSIGALRVIYEITEKNKTVKIIAIRSRGDVYKK